MEIRFKIKDIKKSMKIITSQISSTKKKNYRFKKKNSWEGTKKCGRSTSSRDIKKTKKKKDSFKKLNKSK